ncbi:MAG: hypothetical protein KIT80_10180 [Chitinophagaceae bacterium]|nr:hypothetical protein [Chitinophagaceae bacterium]MCW5927268.1 hypothetical protein [Chitinophagaceae bacterium]
MCKTVYRFEEEHYSYYYPSCFILLSGSLIFGFLFHLLFLRKKNRTKVYLTLFSVLSVVILLHMEGFFLIITNIFRDYQHSSWSVYYKNPNFGWDVVFSILYFAACWFLPSRKSDLPS